MLLSKVTLLGFCVLSGSVGLLAQDCHLALRGHVTELETNEPLAYASVFVREIGRSATTDENGYFAMPNLCEKTAYTVEIRHIECAHFTQIVQLTENAQMDFHLNHNTVLKEVLVVEKSSAPPPTQPVVSVENADLAAAKGINLGETLKKLPGVTLLNTGSTISKPVIQGLHSNRIAIVNNGITLESQQWGTEHAPEIDPFTADKIMVVKGAAGVRYGVGAMAGAIVLEPAPLRNEAGASGWLNLGGQSNGRAGIASGAADWHSKSSSLAFRIQGTYKRSGNLRTPDYFLGNTGASELNFSAMAGWKHRAWTHEIGASRFNQNIGILRASHIGNLTDLERAISSPTPINNTDEFSYDLLRPYQDVAHNAVKYKSVLRLSDKWKLTGQYSFQFNKRREYDVVRSTGSAASKAQVAFRLWSNTLDVALEHFPIHHWQGGVGIQAVQQTNYVSKGGFIPDYQSYGGGVWATERWRRFPKPWEFELGLRYDYRKTRATTNGGLVNLDTLVQFGNLSGTLGLLYHLGKRWTFSLNSGQAWRPPNVNELFARGVHHGAGTYEEGNPAMVAEKAWNTHLSANYQHKRWSAVLSLYRNSIRDFIYLNPGLNTVLTVRGAFPAYYYQQAPKARLQGFDGSLGVPLPKGLSLEAGFSLLRGQRLVMANDNTDAQEWLPLMPADRANYGLKWTLPQKKKQAQDTYLRMGATSVWRQTRIPSEGLLKAAPEGYTVLSFDAAHTFFVFKGARPLEIGLNVQNLTNARYREYLNFFRYYADEPGLNLGLRGKLTF